MKIKQFIELPVIEWDGCNHVPTMRLIASDNISQIIPNGKFKQTKVLLLGGQVLFVNEYYKDVRERIKINEN